MKRQRVETLDARHERLDVDEENDARDQHEHRTGHQHLLDGLPPLALEHEVEVEAGERLATACRAVRVVGRAKEGVMVLRNERPPRHLMRVRLRLEGWGWGEGWGWSGRAGKGVG